MEDKQKNIIPSIGTIVSLVIMCSSIIWAGSKIDSKAEIGYKFATDNVQLPLKIKNLEIRADRAVEPINSIAVMHNQQETFMRDLNELKQEQRAVVNDLKSLEKEILKALRTR